MNGDIVNRLVAAAVAMVAAIILCVMGGISLTMDESLAKGVAFFLLFSGVALACVIGSFRLLQEHFDKRYAAFYHNHVSRK